VIVVSNTSSLTNLAAIGQLGLLRQLYQRVMIPAAVERELSALGAGQPGWVDLAALDWVETQTVNNQLLVQALRVELDEREAEAVALAVEVAAGLLLLDERIARAVAARFGLKYIGLRGALLEAKQQQLIPAVKPLLDDLIQRAGFWISEPLYRRVLQAAGE
jgi:hypothetical protein